nr:bidirectional sugar transporter SWEET5-like [Ipomoea batatas]
MWVFYGMPFVHPDSLLVVTINGAGLVIEAAYIIIFFIYSKPKQRKKIVIALIVEAIFFAAIVTVTLTVLHGTKKRSALIGIVCIVFNVLMYTSPLTVMIPNGLGALSGLVQLVLFAMFYRTTNWDENESNNEVELSSGKTGENV